MCQSHLKPRFDVEFDEENRNRQQTASIKLCKLYATSQKKITQVCMHRNDKQH